MASRELHFRQTCHPTKVSSNMNPKSQPSSLHAILNADISARNFNPLLLIWPIYITKKGQRYDTNISFD